LLDTWPKSSSANSINLVKKNLPQFRRYRIFSSGLFFYWRTLYIRPGNGAGLVLQPLSPHGARIWYNMTLY